MIAVRLLVPSNMTNEDLTLAARVKTVASSAGYEDYQQVRLSQRQVPGTTNWCLSAGERISPMVLYREAHFAKLTVFTLRSPVIAALKERPVHKLNPTLGTLLRYKAYFSVISGATFDAIFASAVAWCTGVHCDGLNDPRILPLHAFSPGVVCELDSNDARTAFERRHRLHGERHDSDRRAWTRGPAHGSADHTVAGFALPTGFHWDVQAGTRSSTFWSGDSEWRIERNGHLNVAADASVRQGSRSKRIGR
jgi:hypothetical protein